MQEQSNAYKLKAKVRIMSEYPTCVLLPKGLENYLTEGMLGFMQGMRNLLLGNAQEGRMRKQ